MNFNIMSLHQLYYDIEENGILHDPTRYREVVDKYRNRIKEHESKLFSDIGYEVNIASHKQMHALLYGELHIPRRKSTDEKTLVALLANVVKDERRRGIINQILELRGYYKALGTYLGVTKNEKTGIHFTDSDGRVRTSYLICGTESGRTSTNKIEPPVRTEIYGLPFQVITKHSEEGKDIRSIFIPSNGYIFIEADQSQAEARVSLLLAKEYEALKLMDEIDIHILTGSWLKGCTYEELKKEITETGQDSFRQLGKVVRHSGNYDAGAKSFVQTAAKFGLSVSEWKSKQHITTFHNYTPGIRQTFHQSIRDIADKDRTLITPFGRKRTFFNKYGDELFKEMYAHIPQSTVADQTKRALLIINEHKWIKILLENHDGALFECPKERKDEAISIIKPAFEMPIDFSTCSLPRVELIIPCEIFISETRWSKMLKI